ncbi:MAG: hypothetical protein IRZ08_21185 [Frankia sp.]|nr:hypothetical protein [Frankia sp.]
MGSSLRDRFSHTTDAVPVRRRGMEEITQRRGRSAMRLRWPVEVEEYIPGQAAHGGGHGLPEMARGAAGAAARAGQQVGQQVGQRAARAGLWGARAGQTAATATWDAGNALYNRMSDISSKGAHGMGGLAERGARGGRHLLEGGRHAMEEGGRHMMENAQTGMMLARRAARLSGRSVRRIEEARGNARLTAERARAASEMALERGQSRRAMRAERRAAQRAEKAQQVLEERLARAERKLARVHRRRRRGLGMLVLAAVGIGAGVAIRRYLNQPVDEGLRRPSEERGQMAGQPGMAGAGAGAAGGEGAYPSGDRMTEDMKRGVSAGRMDRMEEMPGVDTMSDSTSRRY